MCAAVEGARIILRLAWRIEDGRPFQRLSESGAAQIRRRRRERQSGLGWRCDPLRALLIQFVPQFPPEPLRIFRPQQNPEAPLLGPGAATPFVIQAAKPPEMSQKLIAKGSLQPGEVLAIGRPFAAPQFQSANTSRAAADRHALPGEESRRSISVNARSRGRSSTATRPHACAGGPGNASPHAAHIRESRRALSCDFRGWCSDRLQPRGGQGS